MKYDPKIRSIAKHIVDLFEDPESLPAKISPVFITSVGGDLPSKSYSFRNKLLLLMQSGDLRAAGYKTWRKYGRWVRKGGKASWILRPVWGFYTDVDPDTGEEKKHKYLRTCKPIKVFAYSQTDGDPLVDPGQVDTVLSNTTFTTMAENLGVTVEVDGSSHGEGGSYNPKRKHLRVCVENPATFAHELIHAAEHRLEKLTKLGQDMEQEVVAELGGAVLLTLMGHEVEADYGGCYEYVKHYSGDKAIDVCLRLINRIGDAVELLMEAAHGPVQDKEKAA